MPILGYSGNASASGGWFTSAQYNQNIIQGIPDPDGGTVTEMPTAIPSPFARMDLVVTSFVSLLRTQTLKAETRDGVVLASRFDEKMVSNTLDLLELLYNAPNLVALQDSNKWKMHVWNKGQQIGALKASTNIEHKRLGAAIELYMLPSRAVGTVNFDGIDNLYLFEYNGKIIGGTSPATLVFPTADERYLPQIQIAGEDILFDDIYRPLYDRPAAFQVYLYSLFTSDSRLKQRMPIFFNYLEKSKDILRSKNNDLFLRLGQAGSDQIANNPGLTIAPSTSVVEVGGVQLRTVAGKGKVESDFCIKSTKRPYGDNPPLVLHHGFNDTNLTYVEDKWNTTTPVPYEELGPLETRVLPAVNQRHPFLNVSDFLEPYLIKLVYGVDKTKFFDPFGSEGGQNEPYGFLLPLKPTFFKYFAMEDLQKSGADYPKLKIEKLPPDAIRVRLEIPIGKNGRSIILDRMYHEGRSQNGKNPDLVNNKGVIREYRVGVSIFPFLKSTDPKYVPFHKVQLIDADYYGEFAGNEYKLEFFKEDSNGVEEVHHNSSTRRVKIKDDDAGTKYYALRNSFDFIQLSGGDARGIIMPIWPEYPMGGEQFTFAIDFGTSNTHVEFSMSSGGAQPFHIVPEKSQIATLAKPDDAIVKEPALRNLVDLEFIPHVVGEHARNVAGYKLPLRTVLSESDKLNANAATSALSDFNIAFVYEKRHDQRSRFTTNLKWSALNDANNGRVRAFLEQFAMMLRNKVILNHGNLGATRIVWFYPSSMGEGRVHELERQWGQALESCFTSEVLSNTNRMPESLAPYYYFRSASILQGGTVKPVVCVDIGGGTTDVVVFEDNEPKILSSFRFAGNSIFADGYSKVKNNAFAKKYAKIFEAKFAAANVDAIKGLLPVLGAILNSGRSEDINAFLFSVESLPALKALDYGMKDQYSYNQMLASASESKIIFVYFFSAIAYHIASVMKEKGIDSPQNIVFSGTASKLLNVLAPNKQIAGELFRAIFEKVYGQKMDYNYAVVAEDSGQKEVTCKGGLMAKPEELTMVAEKERKARVVLSCLPGDPTRELTYADLNGQAQKDITEYVNRFHEVFLEVSKEFNFEGRLNVSAKSITEFKNLLNELNFVQAGVQSGIQAAKELDGITDDSARVGETPFFYPVIETINKLAIKLLAP